MIISDYCLAVKGGHPSQLDDVSILDLRYLNGASML